MSNERYTAVEAGLQERINGLVEEALGSTNKPLKVSEIEDITLRVRARIGEAVTQALVAKQAPVEVPGPVCEQCGQEKHCKGRKNRRVVSRSGEVEWERPYDYCEKCRRGLFPPR
jgi:hypothetical protein